MGGPIAKEGDLRSEVYLAFVRRQRCAFGGHAGGEAHHHPGKGRSGRTDDSKTLPVCRTCHQCCEGITVTVGGARLQPIPAEAQRIAVLETQRRFFEQASEAEWSQFSQDRRRWRDSQVFTEVAP